MIFCDRTHTVQFINKAVKERYGDVVQVGNFQLYVRHGSTLGSASAGEGDAHQG